MGLRAFLALPIAEYFLAEVSAVLVRLQTLSSEVKWVRPDEVHVTLHFFGDLEKDRIKTIQEIVIPITREFSPFEIGLEKLGSFPNSRKPSVLWMGLRGADPLSSLQSQIEKALSAAGFPLEEHSFHPHATVGRLKNAKDNLFPQKFAGFQFEATPLKFVNHLILFQSQLSSAGPHYEPIADFPFASR